MPNEFTFTKGRVARYALLPEILPRISKFFGTGFSSLPYFIIVLFNTLRIIPDGHPYLSAAYHGRYSILQALRLVSDHLVFDRKNIDRLIIFFTVVVGLIILFVQFVLVIIAMMTAPAFAGLGDPLNPNFFTHPDPTQDLAFRILDLVFGVPDIYNSASEGTTPIHAGLHTLFEFYSFGMVIVATFIIIYLATAIVLETAQSGVPFGQRFNKAWVPVRLILFFGLLLPTATGLNVAQYIVLYSAKLGSNLATNAWLTFNSAIDTTTYYGEADNLIARPVPPNVSDFVTFMQLAKICSWAEGRERGKDIQPYFVYGPGIANSTLLGGSTPNYPYLVQRAAGGTLAIRFGERSEQYTQEDGGVYPNCGELTLTITDQEQPGSTNMIIAYMELIGCAWYGSEWGGGDLSALGDNPMCSNTMAEERGRFYSVKYGSHGDPFPPNEGAIVHDTARTQENILANQTVIQAVELARERQIAQSNWLRNPGATYGWAGAGIWFNKIAEQNGAFTTAVFNIPAVSKMPEVMEYAKDQKMQLQPTTPVADIFSPRLSNGEPLPFATPEQLTIAVILDKFYKFWADPNSTSYIPGVAASRSNAMTGVFIVDAMNVVLGTKGLFDMCQNTDIHPLAQLSSMGKALIEHSIRGFVLTAGSALGSGFLQLVGMQELAASLKGLTSFFVTFAGLGLMIGFLMFYVLPFLPFIYFFFAVMTWVKGIFEAMVGMPLWALAHLRIDGEGMPGSVGAGGYFYILEIFLRPICIIIGFVGGLIIFAAMVKVLNNTFFLAVANLTGHTTEGAVAGCFGAPGTTAAAGDQNMFKRGTIDEFFYTIVYAVLVYIICLPCFKLVDLIPDNIMRWLGTNVASFGAQDGDPAQGLMRNVTVGAGLVGGKLGGAFK